MAAKEFLMTVAVVLPHDGEGKRIVGGAAPHYPAEDISWLDFSGKEVMLQTSAGEMRFKVKEIHVFTSIWGGINIGLTLEDSLYLDAIKAGDKVFKFISDNL